MTPAALLNEARNAGVTLWRECDVLRYRGPREALAKLLPALKAHKPNILAALARPDPLPPLSPAIEARRRKVLAMARDGRQYAILVEDPNIDPVIRALATPAGTCEVLIYLYGLYYDGSFFKLYAILCDFQLMRSVVLYGKNRGVRFV